jgi:rod shape-determining protein MreC
MKRLTRRQRRAALALAVVAVLFLASDALGASYADARGGVQGFFGALYRGTDSVFIPARRWIQALPHLGRDSSTIARLRAQVATLQRQNATLLDAAGSGAQLRRLQLQATRGGYSVLPARVIAIGAGAGFDWTVTLDAGSSDKIKVGQTVIAGPSLVGRVVRVAASSATVLLAADPGSGVGVRDERSGQLGVVTGQGSGGFTFRPLDPNAGPKVGDVLVSGPARSSTYMSGLTVGTVTSVETAPTGAVTAAVKAAVAPASLDIVGVVLIGGTSGPRPPLRPRESADRAQ